MKTIYTVKRILAGVLLWVVVAATGLGTPNTAQAAPDTCGQKVDGVCYGPIRWCPGDSIEPLTQNHVVYPVTWDMNICHTYYHVQPGMGNAGGMNDGIWDGPNPPPPQAPPPAPPGLNFCPIPPWCP
jgi:hypothetical protein